ncbi:MAG: hypothetical protein GEU90_14920 [Gemmatimonas sp.]|nr:hypothetical protein [Gemmatimonas sp.]
MKLCSVPSLLTAMVAVAFTAGPSAGQSLFDARGLGYTLEPIDARSRGLGGVALGLPEPQISWVNPADAVGLLEPGLVIGYQYDNFDSNALVGGTSEGSTARFPLLMAAFPAGSRWVLMAGYGGFLDQNWRLEQPDSLVLAPDTVGITDITSSDGGVARLRFGVAYQILPTLGVGLGVDAYTGDVEHVERRRFEFQDSTAATCCRAAWDYDGLGFTAGIRYVPVEALSIGASLSYGGTLDAEAIPRDTMVLSSAEGESTSFDLPTSFRAGAAGRIGQATVVVLGGSWTGWSTLDEPLLQAGGARDAWTVGGGIEYEGLAIASRPLPLRLGARTGALPFRWNVADAQGWAQERALTVGSGLVLAGGAVRTDVAFEFGNRDGANSGLDESFWRFDLSVRVLGR